MSVSADFSLSLKEPFGDQALGDLTAAIVSLWRYASHAPDLLESVDRWHRVAQAVRVGVELAQDLPMAIVGELYFLAGIAAYRQAAALSEIEHSFQNVVDAESRVAIMYALIESSEAECGSVLARGDESEYRRWCPECDDSSEDLFHVRSDN